MQFTSTKIKTQQHFSKLKIKIKSGVKLAGVNKVKLNFSLIRFKTFVLTYYYRIFLINILQKVVTFFYLFIKMYKNICVQLCALLFMTIAP